MADKNPLTDKDPICYCFEVYEEKIVEIIRHYHITNLDQLQRYTNAGQGCRSCSFDLEDIIRRENNAKLVKPN